MERIEACSGKRDIFNDLPTLETARLLLRKMRLSDAEDLYEYAKDHEVSRYTLWNPHRSIEDARAFLKYVISNYASGIMENWGIEYREDGRFIGTCGFFGWDADNASAEMQYAMSREYSGKGIMTEAVTCMLRFGFERMGLNRIQARCMLKNTASERVMQKAGMTFEGITREAVCAKGAFHDLKTYSILKREWETRTKSLSSSRSESMAKKNGGAA